MNPPSSATAGQTRANPLASFPVLQKEEIEVLQFNIGRLCNQACRHCHVDSSPSCTGPQDNASPELIDRVLELLAGSASPLTLDVTGGAPELTPGFRRLVAGARALGGEVLVRHNLTVQEEPAQEDLPRFFADQGVVLFCSLPCYLEENVDRQRGKGAYEASIRALQRLNEAGFGIEGSPLSLHLVYNPIGPCLPPQQDALEADYERELAARFGIRFSRLLTITNQPIHRFRRDLERQGKLEEYTTLLRDNFNPRTLEGLMCRRGVSLRWDGRLFDCDFNLVRDLPLRDEHGRALHLDDLFPGRGLSRLRRLDIAVDEHCFACTAGCGSSCGGTVVR